MSCVKGGKDRKSARRGLASELRKKGPQLEREAEREHLQGRREELVGGESRMSEGEEAKRRWGAGLARTEGRGHFPVFSELEGLSSQNTP